jgi:hypothetical protein
MKSKFSLLAYLVAISACTAPPTPPIAETQVTVTPTQSTESLPAPISGSYFCQNTAYQDTGYSFVLYPNGTYIKKEGGKESTYSYFTNGGVVDIKWQGEYSVWDKSFYVENVENETKFITLISSTREDRHFCELQD